MNDPIELILTISDYPVGWMLSEKDYKDGGYGLTAAKVRQGIFSAYADGAVISWIGVFPAEASARDEFQKRKEQAASTYSMGSPYLKSESFWYQVARTHIVVFRIQNVLTELTMVDYYGLSDLDPKEWAKKQEARINSVKRLGIEVVRGVALPTPSPTSASSLVPTQVPPAGLMPTPNPILSSLAALPAGDLIAFLSFRDGMRKIFISNADGASATPLTDTDSSMPAWSPDGKKIAFHCYPTAESLGDICVINVDGTGLTQLTSGPSTAHSPVWSPDGKSIAFLRRLGDYDDIFVMKADGSEQRNVTNHPYQDERTVWSPDSRRIAFVSSARLNRIQGVFVVNADGTGLVALSEERATDYSPAWTVDGEWVVFLSYPDGAWQIVKSRPDGTGLSRTYTDRDIAVSALWLSPDGNLLALIRYSDGRRGDEYRELYTIRLDGTELKQITQGAQVDGSQISWSSDSQWLAFPSGRTGNLEIYVVKADGTNEYNFSRNAARDLLPSWQPGVKQ